MAAILNAVVIGGGPVGLAAASALAAHAIDAVVLEARPDEERGDDPRVFALSHDSRLILERLRAWDAIEEAVPIETVDVSQRGRFGCARLRAADLGLPALGYVVRHGQIARALRATLAPAAWHAGVRVESARVGRDAAVLACNRAGAAFELRAHLVVQADGAAPIDGLTRGFVHDYRQRAIVAEVICERAAPGTAYERFTETGPVALLPLGTRHALIWTLPEARAAAILAGGPAEFAHALGERFGALVGRISLATAFAAFPLSLRYARAVAGDRFALIGNAAQTLHPVAGQGFNLGLRDAWGLARALAAEGADDTAVARALARHRSERRLDRAGGTLFTDFLVRAFGNDHPGWGTVRGFGLAVLDACPPMKKWLMRRMIFGAGG